MKTNTMFALGLASALGAGCAASGPVMINGQAVPRAQYRFEGRPYVVKHIDAHPSPTRDVTGYGGRITGPVCGNDVDYEVRHAHGEVTLNGYIDTHFASQIETHDANGERIITGNFGTGAGNSVIDLRLRTNALIGRVGYREYQLMQEGVGVGRR